MTSKITPNTSIRFTNLSVLCAFLVVVMHVGCEFVAGSLGWWVSEILRFGIARVAVPYFFLASAFFLSNKFVEGCSIGVIWKGEVKKRIWTLLVPLLIWPIIGKVWAAPYIMIANYLSGRVIVNDVWLFDGRIWPGVGVLWFVRNLFILVILSPLILCFVRKFKKLWLILVFCLYWLLFTFLDPISPNGLMKFFVYGFSLEGLAYFSLGMYLGQNKLTIQVEPKEAYIALSVGMLLIGCIAIGKLTGMVILNFKHFFVPFLMFAFFFLMPVMHLPKLLTSSSFPIYVLHCLWILPLQCLLNQIPIVKECTLFRFLFTWGGAIVLSIYSAALLRKFSPKIALICFGGR